MWFQFLLTPFIFLFNVMKDWFHGFTVPEIINRRLDWFITHLMILNFLTSFKPLFNFLKGCLLKPIITVIGWFKPQKALSYHEKQYDQLLEKQAQLELNNQILRKKLVHQKKDLENKITKLEKRKGIAKLSSSLEEQKEKEEIELNE